MRFGVTSSRPIFFSHDAEHPTSTGSSWMPSALPRMPWSEPMVLGASASRSWTPFTSSWQCS